jgi:hypothetical protein
MAEQPGNQTPNTPDVSETELRAKKVDELRREAKEAGVSGASGMRKEELVHAVAEAEQAGADGGSSRGGDRTGEQPGNQTPNTPDVSETELRAKKVDELRQEAREAGVHGVSRLRKEELVHAVAEAEQSAADGGSTGGADDGDLGAGPDGGHVRTGEQTSKSIKYSQEITDTEEEPEREGRSLVTTHHEVIREWAESRGGRPSTVPGTEHGDHLGVLRIDFQEPDPNLREVSWDEWFATFDERRLNFIYQEERTDGRTSTFFRLESPDREDG